MWRHGNLPPDAASAFNDFLGQSGLRLPPWVDISGRYPYKKARSVFLLGRWQVRQSDFSYQQLPFLDIFFAKAGCFNTGIASPGKRLAV